MVKGPGHISDYSGGFAPRQAQGSAGGPVHRKGGSTSGITSPEGTVENGTPMVGMGWCVCLWGSLGDPLRATGPRWWLLGSRGVGTTPIRRNTGIFDAIHHPKFSPIVIFRTINRDRIHNQGAGFPVMLLTG